MMKNYNVVLVFLWFVAIRYLIVADWLQMLIITTLC